MKNFTLEEIAIACNGKFVGDSKLKNVCITSVERDSRMIKNGSLFLAIKGERVDGHDYVQKCFDSGAVCAVCEKPIENADKPYILVDSTLVAVKKIAKAYRKKFDIPIIGVSGSVGKTSTKEMLYAVVSQKYKTHKTQGNLNNELGVPLTILSMPEDTEVAIIEMGISDFGEMTRLSEIVCPTICVLTIIGFCHLENLGDRNGVLKAKTEMFKFADKNAEFILNGDDDKLCTVESINGKKPIFFGLSDKNRYFAKNIKNSGENGVSCTLCFDENSIDVTIPAIGNYMVSNALAAVAAGKILGLSNEQLKNGVEAYKTVGSRANVINTGRIKIIDDCYNANPTSVKASLNTLKNFDGRKIAVLGDMKELGEDELSLHFETGVCAKENADLVFAVGELAKELAKGADGEWFAEIEDAETALKEQIKDGDTVLVKASHSMQFEKIVEFLRENF